jgi:hypothetical protein
VFFLFAQLKPQLEREEEVYTADGYVEQGALSHPCHNNKDVARVGHPDPTLTKETLRAYSPITRSRAGIWSVDSS